MGEDPDFDIDDLIDDKWYCCHVDIFLDGTAKEDCSQDWWTEAKCCKLGSFIKNFLNSYGECNKDFGLCASGPGSAQKIINLDGPYDTYSECNVACV